MKRKIIKNIELYIAIRQLKAKWKQSTLAILSVAVGVMILICALSLANGFEKDLVDKILGTNPHISIEPGISDRILNYKDIIEKIEKIEGVKAVTPLIRGQALLNNGIEVRGILVYGADPKAETKASNWDKYLVSGNLNTSDQESVVLGYELAKKMGLGIGDRIQIITGIGAMTQLRVTGIFQANFYEIDVRVAFINIPKAQNLYSLNDAINSISVKLYDPFEADNISLKISEMIPAFNIRSWISSNKGLLSAMALEKKVIFLVMLFIIIVAMLGIANLLVMIVLEKTMEISILRAIGASKMNISLIFLYQGLVIGLFGIIIGCISGYGLSFILSKYPVGLPSDIYIIDSLPVEMQITDFIYVSLAAFIICLVTSFVPARRAVRLNPIEALRKNM